VEGEGAGEVVSSFKAVQAILRRYWKDPAAGNALRPMQWYSPETNRAGSESQSMRLAAGCVKSTMARNAL
jgi:hypothetical protein